MANRLGVICLETIALPLQFRHRSRSSYGPVAGDTQPVYDFDTISASQFVGTSATLRCSPSLPVGVAFL